MERLGIDSSIVFKQVTPIEGLEEAQGYSAEDEGKGINLLSTIKLPKNLKLLSTRLPKANYGGDEGYNSSTTTHGNYQSGLLSEVGKKKKGKENRGFESDSGQ